MLQQLYTLLRPINHVAVSLQHLSHSPDLRLHIYHHSFVHELHFVCVIAEPFRLSHCSHLSHFAVTHIVLFWFLGFCCCALHRIGSCLYINGQFWTLTKPAQKKVQFQFLFFSYSLNKLQNVYWLDYKMLIDYKCTQMQLFIELIIWRLAELHHMWWQWLHVFRLKICIYWAMLSIAAMMAYQTQPMMLSMSCRHVLP